jgi:hypothetical protein
MLSRLLDSAAQILFTLLIRFVLLLTKLRNSASLGGSSGVDNTLSFQSNQPNALERVTEARPGVSPGTGDAFFAGRMISRKDLSFTHSIFVQCFLPMRALPPQANQRWEVNHGSASLSIEAGRLADPQQPGHWEPQEIPSGPKARLLFAYINDFAIRHKTPVVDLGKSLRAFMEKNRVPIGGPNGHEIGRQLKNIAAARILLGIWSEAKVTTRQARVAAGIDFWKQWTAKQGTLWEPEMHLAPEYFEELKLHRVPVYFPALVKLQANPRAMDVFCWLVYRIRSVGYPVKIPYTSLHPVFGRGIRLLKHFKAEFRKALMAAHQLYPQARIELKEDQVVLYRSPLLIPPEL